MQGSNNIKSFQLALIIFVSQTGITVLTLPTHLSKDTGHDGWISLIITAVLIIIFSMLIALLLKRYYDKGIYDINHYLFGKVVGTCINALLVLYMTAATASGCSLFNYIIRSTLLQQTPSWVLTPLLTIPSFYLVWYGLKSMSRFFFLTLISYFVVDIFLVLLYKEFRPTFLLPVGEAGIGRILTGMRSGFFAFSGFELIAFFYPYITDRKKVTKWYVGASLASLVFLLAAVAASVAIMGQNFLNVLSAPFFRLARLYNASVFERVDIYIIAIWFIPMACSLRNYIFGSFDGAMKVFGLKKTKLLFFIFFVVIQLLAHLPRDTNQMIFFFELTKLIGAGTGMFFVLCLFLSFIRKKGTVCGTEDTAGKKKEIAGKKRDT